MLITNGTIVQSGVRRRTIHRQVSFGPVSLRIVTIVILAAASFFALMNSTKSATKAYEVSQKEGEVIEKQKQITELENEAYRLRSLRDFEATLTATDASSSNQAAAATQSSTPAPVASATPTHQPTATPTPQASSTESLVPAKEINYLPSSSNSTVSRADSTVVVP